MVTSMERARLDQATGLGDIPFWAAGIVAHASGSPRVKARSGAETPTATSVGSASPTIALSPITVSAFALPTLDADVSFMRPSVQSVWRARRALP